MGENERQKKRQKKRQKNGAAAPFDAEKRLKDADKVMHDAVRRRVHPNDRDDVCQDALIEFWKKDSPAIENPQGFATGIVRNTARNHNKCDGAAKRPAGLGDKDVEVPDGKAMSREDRKLLHDRRDTILRRLGELPVRTRRVLLAALTGNDTWLAIAQVTGMERSEAKKRTENGVRYFRENPDRAPRRKRKKSGAASALNPRCRKPSAPRRPRPIARRPRGSAPRSA